jgi:para-aminobenzoate synthetase/4-amino-4-deoxychorismate lyase
VVREQTPQFDFAAAPAADRALGVFETMLVRDGGVALLERHLERLLASVRALYRAELPADTRARAVSAAAGHALARLRIEVVPQPGEPPAVGFDLAALAETDIGRAEQARLVTVGVAGGNGEHKLIDRSWLREIEAHVGGDVDIGVRALLVSRSGTLLETTRANVLLLRGGALATPPLDGSILPGVVRAAVLAHAERLGIDAHELPLTLERLRDADMVLLSGSLRLLERANVRCGNRRSAGVAERLSEALAADTVST